MTIIAIDSSNEDLAGAIVYWRLSGNANGDDLNNALRAAGVHEDALVSLPTPKRAVRRALTEHQGGPLFVRAGRQCGGLFLVRQTVTDGTPDFEVCVEARLDTAGNPHFTAEPTSPTTATDLNDRFWHHIMHVNTTDISAWLIREARTCDAVSLRETGGVYFIPRHALDGWRRRVEALMANSLSRVYMVPAMNSEEAVDAMLDGLLDEARALTDELTAVLDADELGEAALRNRAKKAQALLDKLDRYERVIGSVLGGKLTDVRNEIEEQKANAIAAALTLEGAA